MSCDLSEIAISFPKSEFEILPYSIDIRQSRQHQNNFDHVQTTVSKEAGQYIADNATHKAPINIVADKNGNNLYRGWYTNDSIQLGESKATLEIQDPRKLLKVGTVDKEWGRITLGNVVKYVFERRIDPHNVIPEQKFVDANVDEQHLQFEKTGVFGGGTNREDLPARSDGLENFLRETIPFVNGDGNFDFREESPYSALLEICDIWETEFWIENDGTLVIGHPDIDTTIYPAGTGKDNWNITEWNLPSNLTPLKAVIIKGKSDHKGGKDNAGEELWNVVSQKKKYQTRASAGFLDDDELEEVVYIDGKKGTVDPKALKRMARSAFLEQHTRNNKGSIVINASANNNVSPSQYTSLKIGDQLWVNDYQEKCANVDEGTYDIHSVQHEINGTSGWSITLDVSKAITDADEIKDRFWYFDPSEEIIKDFLEDYL